jgi:hypothetical protein
MDVERVHTIGKQIQQAISDGKPLAEINLLAQQALHECGHAGYIAEKAVEVKHWADVWFSDRKAARYGVDEQAKQFLLQAASNIANWSPTGSL